MKVAEKGAFWTQPTTFRTVLWILVIVGSLTSVNVLWNHPPTREAQTDDRWRGYTSYYDSRKELSFVYPGEGMAFYNVSFEGVNASNRDGGLYGYYMNVSSPLEEAIVIWRPNKRHGNLESALEYAYQTTGVEDPEFITGPLLTGELGHHTLLYQFYNSSDTLAGEQSGIVGVWNCTDTKRVFIGHLIYPRDAVTPGELQEAYEEFLEDFKCHFRRRIVLMTLEERQEVKREKKIQDWLSDLGRVSTMAILCIGFTFTYKMEKFPNFAHINYAGIGSIVSWSLTRFFGLNPYDTWLFATLAGGILGMLLYRFVVRPVGSRAADWNRPIVLTFVFFVIAQALISVVGMYNYYTRNALHIASTGFRLWDSIRWNLFGIQVRGIALLGPFMSLLLILGLHYFLKSTKYGISLMATAEDEGLAAIMGVDVNRAHLASWFLSSALAAYAGTMMSISGGFNIFSADELIVSVMAGSVLGGLENIYGAIIGGAFVAIGEKALKGLMFRLFGLVVIPWKGIYPIIFLVTVMMLAPDGILTIPGEISKRIDDLRKKRRKKLEDKQRKT